MNLVKRVAELEKQVRELQSVVGLGNDVPNTDVAVQEPTIELKPCKHKTMGAQARQRIFNTSPLLVKYEAKALGTCDLTLLRTTEVSNRYAPWDRSKAKDATQPFNPLGPVSHKHLSVLRARCRELGLHFNSAKVSKLNAAQMDVLIEEIKEVGRKIIGLVTV